MPESNQGASPKSPRYFYVDPLAAAWMAHRHGFHFEHTPFSSYNESGGFCTKITIYHAEPGQPKFYVHPDSVALLEPQAGDLVFYDNLHGGEAWDEFKCLISPADERYPYIDTAETLMLMDSGEHPYRKELRRIIQRNGIPFMWPESEAA